MAKQEHNTESRRDFLKSTTMAALGASAVIGTSGCSDIKDMTKSITKGKSKLIERGEVILFQGDSITDAGRNRGAEGNANDRGALGHGYVEKIASRILANRADDNLKIYNRGISGNKVFQLADRWQKDCLDIKPTLLSILIGVNDIWHGLNGEYDGTVGKYEKDFMALMERTVEALPTVKLVVCEPFVLRTGAVNDKWFPEFDYYRMSAKKVAERFDAVFVPFQTMFDDALAKARASYWAGDGVHPSMTGAQLMAQTWLDYVCGRKC